MKIYIVVELFDNESCICEVFTSKRKANAYIKACKKETGNDYDTVIRHLEVK